MAWVSRARAGRARRRMRDVRPDCCAFVECDRLGVTVEWLSLAIALLGAGVAVFIPLAVEYARRPVLEVVLADDLNIEDREPKQRIVHVRVVNYPLSGWRGRWLLRNVANGCRVKVRFISRSDGSRVDFNGRWSGNSEPFTPVPVQGGVARVPDPTKVPQTRLIDVSPSEEGQVVGIAIKTHECMEAYGFGPESYLHDRLQNPDWRLPHEEYDVEISAEAGGLMSPIATFVLHNDGADYRGLKLARVT